MIERNHFLFGPFFNALRVSDRNANRAGWADQLIDISLIKMATILVIDDDPDVRATLCDMLESFGHVAIQAKNGRAGLQAITRSAPDLVICDIFMPEFDGLGVIRELTQALSTPPILAISGRYSHYLKVAQMLGASAALAKPCGPTELRRAVDALLDVRSEISA